MKTKLLVLLLLLATGIFLLSCNKITEDYIEDEIGDTIEISDSNLKENQESEDSESAYKDINTPNEEPINPYAFEGPLTDNFLDEVNIHLINLTSGRYGLPYDKGYSNELKWDEISSMMEKIFSNIYLQEPEPIGSDEELIKEYIFNKSLPENREQHLKLKYIVIYYKHPVVLPFNDFQVKADEVCILLRQDSENVECYVRIEEQYWIYQVDDLKDYFDEWFDDYALRHHERIR